VHARALNYRGLLIILGDQSLKSENRDSYNERNFENLVDHYEKELRRILRGVSVSKILSKSERAIDRCTDGELMVLR